jgi:hypothetical protein
MYNRNIQSTTRLDISVSLTVVNRTGDMFYFRVLCYTSFCSFYLFYFYVCTFIPFYSDRQIAQISLYNWVVCDQLRPTLEPGRKFTVGVKFEVNVKK